MSMDPIAEMMRAILGEPKRAAKGGCGNPNCPRCRGEKPTGGRTLDTDGAIKHIRAGGSKPVYLMAVTPDMQPCEVGPFDPGQVVAALELSRKSGTPALAVPFEGGMALAAILHPVEAGEMGEFIRRMTELALEAKGMPKLDAATWLMATVSPATLESEPGYKTSSLGELLARLSGEPETREVFILVGKSDGTGHGTVGHLRLGTVAEVRERFPKERFDDPVYLTAEADAKTGIAIDAAARIDHEARLYRLLYPEAGEGIWIAGIKTPIPAGRTRNVRL